MSAGTGSGSAGELAVLPDDAQLECGVCWWVYDPSLGDPFAQVAPGTPFTALPAHWHCPNCDAPKARFLLVG
jgi:rubredoxin